MAVKFYRHADDPKTVVMVFYDAKNEGIAFIDAEDYHKIKDYCWYIKDTTTATKGYIVAKIDGQHIRLHRFIMGLPATGREHIADHIDRDPWNNRKSNLRICDYSTNNRNSSIRSCNKSGKTGVFYVNGRGTRSAKWVAQITVNGKRVCKNFSISVHGELAKEKAEAAYTELEKQLE